MVKQENNKVVSAIIPAYNEARRIAKALDVLSSYSGFVEIIVVDDGSTDETEDIVRGYPRVRYLKNEINLGKGMSMDRAVNESRGDIIFFCDADIHGLTHSMIRNIVEPVVQGMVPMCIGMRDRKIHFLRHAFAFVPLLGGERALTKALWQQVPAFYKSHFRIETALNFFARFHNAGYSYTVCDGLFQTIKEKKYGIVEGMRRRFGMVADIVATHIRLRVEELPTTTRMKKAVVTRLALNTVSFVLGIIFLLAGSIGPLSFIHIVLAHELQEDPRAPIANMLIRAAAGWRADIVLILGLTVACSALIILLVNVRRAFHLFRRTSSLSHDRAHRL